MHPLELYLCSQRLRASCPVLRDTCLLLVLTDSEKVVNVSGVTVESREIRKVEVNLRVACEDAMHQRVDSTFI
jgi:hypothetical protein